MSNTSKAQQLSDGFHMIEEKARELAMDIAEQKKLANEIATDANLSLMHTQRTMNQLSAADVACNEMASRIALSHVAAEKLGNEIRADFPWDCPDAEVKTAPLLKVVG